MAVALGAQASLYRAQTQSGCPGHTGGAELYVPVQSYATLSVTRTKVSTDAFGAPGPAAESSWQLRCCVSGATPRGAGRESSKAVQPAVVLQGDARSLLAELPDPDRVLLGGGGAARAELLEALLPRLRAGGVVVIPLATLEAVAELRPVLEAHGLQVSLVQLQVSRGMPLAGGTRLAPLNPVVVLRGCRA